MLCNVSGRIFGFGLMLLTAAPVKAETPADLRLKIEEAVAVYNAMVPGRQDAYSLDSIDVVPKGEGFRVILSGLRMTLDPEASSALGIGRVAFDMRPDADVEGEPLYRVSDVDVPKSWSYLEGGKDAGQVDLGGVVFEGLWSFAFLSFLSGEARLDSIALQASDGSGVAALKSLAARWSSKDKGAGRFDVDGNVTSEGIRVSDDEGHLALAAITGSFAAPDFDLGSAARAWRKIAAAGGPDNLSEDDLGDEAMAGIFPKSFNGDAQITLRGLSGSDRESKQGFEVETLDLGYNVTDSGPSFSKVRVSLAPLGLRLVGPGGGGKGLATALLPADAAAVISLDRFPLATFMQMSRALAVETAASEAQGEAPPSDAEAQQLGLRIVDAMMAAGTSVDLTGTRFKTPDSEFVFKGGFVGDPAAHYRARGQLEIEASGFDALVGLVQTGMADPDPEVQKQAAGANFILALLKGYAQRDASDPDRPVDRFLVELAPDGAVSVNGQPLLPPQTAR